VSNIVVPQLGESVVEARVARWLKREGDRVEVGEPLVELETEKIDLEVGAEHGGVLASIKRHEGEDVKVGELLAVVDDGAAAQASSAAASSASASAREPIAAAHRESAAYQASVWPRTFRPLLLANWTIESASEKLNCPRLDRTVAHFSSLSGTTTWQNFVAAWR